MSSAPVSMIRCATTTAASCQEYYVTGNTLYTIGRGVFALIFLLFFFCSGFVLRLAVEVFVFKCRTIHVC